MLSLNDLRQTVKAHFKDSEILFQNGRFNGSIYLCGYAVEIALKLRITKTLRWDKFPENSADFKKLSSFKTHDLDVLLQLSGTEKNIKSSHLADWSIIAQWDPEVRYKSASSATKTEAQQMLVSSKRVLGILGVKV